MTERKPDPSGNRPEPEDPGGRNALKQIAETVQRLEEMLTYVPDAVAKDLRLKIEVLRKTILEQRVPAFVLVGRRGAGKSSVVNALFGAKVAEVGHVKSQTGQGRWYDYKSELGQLAILDTRGVQEGSTPAEADAARDAMSSILVEIRRRAPDVVLFVVKASEVDSALDADLDALERVLGDIEREHRTRPPLIGIVTHCDVVEPKDTRLHAPEQEDAKDVEEKIRRIADIESLLRGKLDKRSAIRVCVDKVLGVSTYLSWREDGSLRADGRWHIDALSEQLFRLMPEDSRAVFARVARVQKLQDQIAQNLTRAVAALAAGVAAVPIPVADLVPITALQVSLIVGIAWIGGRSLTPKSAAEFLASLGVNVGAAFVLREAARALVKYVLPGAGSAVSSAIAFAGTMAIGAAARAYFLRGESLEKAKSVFRREAPKEERKDEDDAKKTAPDAPGAPGGEE